MDLTSDITQAVARHEVQGIRFGMYTDEDVRQRSVIEITSPQAYDALGTALPAGLYDPLLGPTDNNGSAPCLTCGQLYNNCPGHWGHIELCVPVYQPLTFSTLLNLLRMKCFNCHNLRLDRHRCKIFVCKFYLIDTGRVKEALELDNVLACMKEQETDGLGGGSNKQGRATDISANSSTKRKKEMMANIQMNDLLDSYLQEMKSRPNQKVELTSHERSIRRQLIKEFISLCKACVKCHHCNAFSPKIRQDSSNKIFQGPLSKKHKDANDGNRIKMIAAVQYEQRMTEDGNLAGFVSDDSEGEELEDEVNLDNEDDNEEDGDYDDHDLLGHKTRESSVSSNKADKLAKDKFMTALEVEAQARISWGLASFLCSHIFGCAHSGITTTEDVENNNQGYSMFFMKTIAVPPSRFRPPMTMGTMVIEHSQNHYLNKVLSLNDQVRTMYATAEAKGNSGDIEENEEEEKELARVQDAMHARAISSWIDLQTHVNCFIDSSKDPSATPAANVPTGIRQLLEKKEGMFRKHMMGKRVNFACRSVISPDPYIGTNEIALPTYFAKTLTYPCNVTELNIDEMQKLVKRGPNEYPGARWVEYPDGRRVELERMGTQKRDAIAARLLSQKGITKVGRQLRNGDLVLMNRQPTLHKPGIMAHYVRILRDPTQKTIKMHYANCNTYNADYDGDEMNCHFPQNLIATAEAECIAKTDLQYIVPTDGSPLRGLIQDHVDAGVKLTAKSSFLEKWEYQQLLFSCLSTLEGLEVIQSDCDIEMLPPAIRKPKELWTGKQVISTLLHHIRKGKDGDNTSKEILPGVSVERKTKTPKTAFGAAEDEHKYIVRDGELLCGVLDKAAFGATDFSLVHAVYEAYGPTKAGLLLNAFGRLFTAYLQYYSGHSCRMEDLILTPETDSYRRELVKSTYNMGARAAKAWADSDGGKVKVAPIKEQPDYDKELKPFEAAATASKISELLSGEEGKDNAAAFDAYMQSNLNPLASDIIKSCIPDGLVVPFPANTFSLMVNTGAKGSMVNQSQVCCGLGQQALEGRRVPRMSSGRTMPSFAPYDPNPRADGFIADRFLTGIRPQEYYHHCMAGREGLVDTAVKTSRSGYLQRCLVKHLEELKVGYDHTVRDGEGSLVQFMYGEDGIDPVKAAHLDGSSSTLQYIARNHEALQQRYSSLPKSSLDIAAADRKKSNEVNKNSDNLLQRGSFVMARKLRIGTQWKRGSLCQGWYGAIITKVYPGGHHYDLIYTKDGSKSIKTPIEVEFSGAGSKYSDAMSSICTIIKPSVPDPIISDSSRERGGHKLGSSGSCVSERVAGSIADALENDKNLNSVMERIGLSDKEFRSVVSAKYASALAAPGEAVGCIAAQSIGEPSTQMTLNTFHLAGAGANVTLGIPRLREIIMTASRELKTPTMSVPLLPSVSEKEAIRLTRYFSRLNLMELIASHAGITVKESLQQSASGSWERAYNVILKVHSPERIEEAFGLTMEDIAMVIASKFIPTLAKIMKMELKRSSSDAHVEGGEASDFIYEERKSGSKKSKDYNEDDHDAAGIEDGVLAQRYGAKKEMASYGDMDEDDKIIQRQGIDDDLNNNFTATSTPVTDDEDEEEHDPYAAGNAVKIDRKRHQFKLKSLTVDPSARPLLMVGLVEKAAVKTLVKSRPKIECAYINDEDDRGKCLQTAGCNFSEIWQLDNLVDYNKLMSNDIWALRCSYGVEAARMNIVDQIRGVFAVYGISVDPRHLTLIADYMTYDGGFKAMNRIGMNDSGSSFLQMSFETTATFMLDAAMNNKNEGMMSPSANIVLGRPMKHGTGAFECVVQA